MNNFSRITKRSLWSGKSTPEYNAPNHLSMGCREQNCLNIKFNIAGWLVPLGLIEFELPVNFQHHNSTDLPISSKGVLPLHYPAF